MSENTQTGGSERSDTDRLRQAQAAYASDIQSVCTNSALEWSRIPYLALMATPNPVPGGRWEKAYRDWLWVISECGEGRGMIVVDCETGAILELGQTYKRPADPRHIVKIDPDLLDPVVITAKLERLADENLIRSKDNSWGQDRHTLRVNLAAELDLYPEGEALPPTADEPIPVVLPHGTRSKGHLTLLVSNP